MAGAKARRVLSTRVLEWFTNASFELSSYRNLHQFLRDSLVGVLCNEEYGNTDKKASDT